MTLKLRNAAVKSASLGSARSVKTVAAIGAASYGTAGGHRPAPCYSVLGSLTSSFCRSSNCRCSCLPTRGQFCSVALPCCFGTVI